jgi:hypothetical protein
MLTDEPDQQMVAPGQLRESMRIRACAARLRERLRRSHFTWPTPTYRARISSRTTGWWFSALRSIPGNGRAIWVTLKDWSFSMCKRIAAGTNVALRVPAAQKRQGEERRQRHGSRAQG